MGSFALQQGIKVNLKNESYILLRKVTDETWQLENIRTKRIYEYTDHQLRSFYVNGHLTSAKSDALNSQPNPKQSILVNITPEQWEQAKIRRVYVKAILDTANTTDKLVPIINKVWENLRKPETAPNPVTVFRWKKKYIGSGNDIVALVERHDKKGNKTRRYPEEVIQIVEKAVDKIFLTPERNTIQDVIDRAIVHTHNENQLRPSGSQLPLPTRTLVNRTIRSIPAFDIYSARYGRTAAVKRFRSVQAQSITLAPLERAEIDHTLLDLIVIDDKTSLPLGRPWVTACIDNYSRCVLGINISFEPPSYRTVSHCLLDTFCPKTSLKEKYPNIKNAWHAHGIMQELVVDNGTEFHSMSLENACYSLGIEIHYAPRKKAWFKGKIERFLKTYNSNIAHGTPGTTFQNIFEKDEYDPSKHAIVRMNTLQALTREWIVDFYHQRPHRALNAPPAIVWQSSIQPEDILLPDDLTLIEALLGRSEQRVLTHKGIELYGLLYNSPELAELRRKIGDKLNVEIRVDEANLGHINVLSPDKNGIFKVPALFFEYTNGLSSWQHRVCKKFAACELKKYDPMSWLQAKEDIIKLIEEEFMLKKRKTRSRIARFEGGPATDEQQSKLPVQISPPQIPQKSTSEKYQIAVDIPEDSLEQQPQPKKKFKVLHRERALHLIEASQSESTLILPHD